MHTDSTEHLLTSLHQEWECRAQLGSADIFRFSWRVNAAAPDVQHMHTKPRSAECHGYYSSTLWILCPCLASFHFWKNAHPSAWPECCVFPLNEWLHWIYRSCAELLLLLPQHVPGALWEEFQSSMKVSIPEAVKTLSLRFIFASDNKMRTYPWITFVSAHHQKFTTPKFLSD